MVTCPYDLVRGPFKGTSILLLECGMVSLCKLKSEVLFQNKLQCGLNMAYDFKVTKSCDNIIDIIKVETTLQV